MLMDCKNFRKSQSHNNRSKGGHSSFAKVGSICGAGDKISFENQTGDIFDVSGHTVGHIALYFSSQNFLFSGDSLMALGCGRLFEGTAGKCGIAFLN